MRYWVVLGVRLLVAVAIVGWVYSYLTPGGGEKEFQRSLDALKQVHSVRVAFVSDPTATQHNEVSWDLVCAQDAYRYKWHMVESDPERPGEMNRDELHLGGLEYEHQADGNWSKGKYNNMATAAVLCRNIAQGVEERVMPPIATMIRRGVLQKGDKKTVNGVRCREWNVTMRGGTGGLEHDTICLGVDDHLPYEMTVDWQRSRTTFTDYNSSFQLELPEAAVQQASSTN